MASTLQDYRLLIDTIKNVFMRGRAVFVRLVAIASGAPLPLSSGATPAADDPAAKTTRALRIGFVPGS